MITTPEEAAERLRETMLRDFGPPRPHEQRDAGLPSYRVTLDRDVAPIPVLMRYALSLIGLRHGGPGEKVAWWVSFSYKGFDCELAHQKFGLHLRIAIDGSSENAQRVLGEMVRKLAAAVRLIEPVLEENASSILNAGNVTVANQHVQLRRAYDYFRDRALNPIHVDDVTESGTSESGTWTSYLSGRNVMAMNAFHDLVAAITAFLSALEHDLVLALPFLDFDPATDTLTEHIGARWGEKWRRVVGHQDTQAVQLRERLTDVVERWRNPYSHGGFEKGQGATLYLHTPGIGALPIGLTSVRNSPLFSLFPASETQIADVFALFDEIDDWFARALPHVKEWIESGLDVRFDREFIEQAADCIRRTGSLEELVDEHGYQQAMIDNMDY